MEIVIVMLPNLSKYRKGSDLGAERDLDDMVAARLLYRNGTLFNCAYAMSSNTFIVCTIGMVLQGIGYNKWNK
jgi:hypothetical protein